MHEIISFKQSKWLEKYIGFHAKKRAIAKNDFEKNFINKCLILFMENVWKMLEIDVR